MSTPLKTLIAKLNPVCRKATERAASHCFARGHYEVDLEHLFLALLDESTGDVPLVLRASGVDPHALRADLERELERLKTGNTRTPVFSVHLSELFEQAWLIASLDSQIGRIRSGHLLLALLTGPDLAQFAQRMSSQFARVRVDDLKHKFDEIAAGSSEAEPRHADADVAVPDGAAASGDAPRGPSKTPALDTYTTNLTQRAREGKIDPVIGRDAEIRQAIDILMRRRQNNPIMTGEAGVGKTAVVEGLALRIAADDVPPPLRGVALHVLDMGLLQAGASVKGEFENRLKSVIDEVKKSAHPIILFIDEAHTIIGAGGQAGQNDAANLLKPALARGELRTIAATTWSEYKKYFEKDAALARRFQVVKIEEPSEPLAAAMLRGMAALMERHFNVRVLDDAITEAVRLSHRYISGRQLPDKAISVLDTACAKVALAHSSTPAAIDDAKKRIERIDAEIAALEREAASGAAHDARLAELREARDADLKALAEDAARYEEERALVTEIGALRAELDAARESSADGKPVDVDATRAKLAERVDALRARQGNQPMVPLQVDGHVVAEIVASWTGIPLGRMVKDEIETVLNLRDLLGARVIGQDHALGAIAQRVRTATANLEDPNKPRGVFMFVGPSGVGKTETALALADVLYGGERKMITINMSEYQEAHSVSGLKGSPPGYVGYGEGGVLTEAVRRNPYSVVLLDEVEKAHPDVLEMFFQVFDKGAMDDAEGREIDFRNTLIILTSNVGSSAVMQACLNKAPQELPDAETLAETLRPQLYKTFKPAFLGRMKVIPYYPISDDVLAEIIELKLERIRRRIEANHKAAFEWDESLVDAVLARCTEVDSGARNVDHILNGTLLPEIAELVLSRIADGEAIVRIAARAAETGEFEYTVE
ncbi:type VI secretion system ATPase TssH [Burkholderia pseudomallei]|uniref:type VI secretion system ATPase TssH n=1 Tax=Burkholderia pseudomallei TaxID=28450 RepID=UPI0002D859A1|nr:type VI secretion system ATPase TssH [Burkholderia pseudomallei]AGZ27581.1 type VI secretion ATPase, ClpV1 family [Burkholderia pseudomallei NCTC 13179]AHE33515.1 type VI secretion ATPase, ClpV1 family [Burkholderia pseudomallei NAU20B-16]AHG33763.1 type VI secretion ATPase, ClpV1 family [Burkholderia pseudomallei MSHR511]AHG66418.1 type VI secretion ATPase, ClpV1 family [Burkholderia pseudomallei MSHR146]AIV47488.1 type VI secretion ATPase, ClpV1 family [Burkholderia pseudomallei TSV 48]